MKFLPICLLMPALAMAQENPFSGFNKIAYGQLRSWVLASAEKMPEANYSFKPVETVRTYGDPQRAIFGVRSIEQAKKFRAAFPQSRQLGLIDKPDEIEAFAAAGVEMIRLWPKWLDDAKKKAK